MSHKPSQPAKLYSPDSDFVPENHYYDKCLNAQPHPLVKFFYHLDTKRILNRYAHLYPDVNLEELTKVLTTPPKNFRWAGADLFYTTQEGGSRHMIVIETNSCPSGQKSWPFFQENEERNGYLELIRRTIKPYLKEAEQSGTLIEGKLAVVYDKNPMETHGYAITMAQEFQEDVLIVEMFADDPNPKTRWTQGNRVLEAQTADGVWHPIRAAFRYVTQKPWTRLPVLGSPSKKRTLLFNPIISCLAGGRNKLVAAKAYEFFNSRYADKNFHIRFPETIQNVRKAEIPLWVNNFGGFACVKIPYSNAGQGVFTLTKPEDLQEFMDEDTKYDKYIVQSLVGNHGWSSKTTDGTYYHVGTVPNQKGQIFVADLRMQVSFDFNTGQWRPLALYARRALKPLLTDLKDKEYDSWEMLGTNLSVKLGENMWNSETTRLMLMDARDFNKLGIALDDLIDGFIQTCFATIAIDNLSQTLEENGEFNMALFESINHDPVLIKEIMREEKDDNDDKKDGDKKDGDKKEEE